MSGASQSDELRVRVSVMAGGEMLSEIIFYSKKKNQKKSKEEEVVINEEKEEEMEWLI